jgi:hypothetical protein
MSFFGSNFGSGLGTPDNHIADIIYNDNGDFSFIPSDGFGNMFYGVYLDSILKYSIYAKEGEYTGVRNITGKEDSIVSILGLGQLDNNVNLNVLEADDVDSKYISIKFDWIYDVIDPPEFPALTSVQLTGVTKNMLGQSVENMETRGELSVYAEKVGSDVNVIIYDVNESELCSGTATISGTTALTLTESNDSGVSGSIQVLDEAVVENTVNLTIRYPKEMRVLRDTTTPPTTPIASIQYDGKENYLYTEKNTLAVGDYYYALAALSDTDDLGDASTPFLVTISGAPLPVTNLQYVSGNYSNTLISFTPSATVGATYNVYVSDENGVLNTNEPYDTLIAGSTEVTLGTLVYPNSYKILIRAEFGGVEEKNMNYLELEYGIDGEILKLRPNTPSISSISVKQGNTVTVHVSYDTTNELNDGATVQVFTRLYDELYDLTTPSGTGTLTSFNVSGVKTGNVTIEMPNGTYYYVARVIATDGGVGYISNEVEKFASDENMSAPTGITYYA